MAEVNTWEKAMAQLHKRETPSDAVLFTVEECARVLRVSRPTVYRLVAKGDLQALKIGDSRNGALRVLRTSLQGYVERQTRALMQPK